MTVDAPKRASDNGESNSHAVHDLANARSSLDNKVTQGGNGSPFRLGTGDHVSALNTLYSLPSW